MKRMTQVEDYLLIDANFTDTIPVTISVGLHFRHNCITMLLVKLRRQCKGTIIVHGIVAVNFPYTTL